MTDVEVHDVDRLAAVIIFITSIIGFVINGFIAVFIHRLSGLRNSFGRLLQLQAMGDAVFVAIWGFYFAPVLFFDIRFLQILPIAGGFAQLCLICYDISIYTHLVIALNRFISLYFPTHYTFIFTNRFTNVLVIAIVAVSFLFSWFLVIVNCRMGFSKARWMLDYVIPPCNITNVYYAEFTRGLVVISAFAVINILTFTRMHLRNSNRKQTCAFESVNAQQIKRRKVEKAFVQQVTAQSAIYVTELITYFFVSEKFPVNNENLAEDRNRWPNFLLTTYAWILIHTLDGVITLIFNRQFREVVLHPIRSISKATQNLSKSPSKIGSAQEQML